MPVLRAVETADENLRTLVIGAGSAGLALARDLTAVRSFGLLPIGFLDDDPGKRARRYDGMPVLGGLDDLEEVLTSSSVDVVVIAIPSLAPERFQEMAHRAAAYGVTVQHLPPFLASLQRQIVGTDMRSLQVGALIGRPEMHVVSRRVADVLTGKRVLVTGAGGSIGSELCRQVSGFDPESLIMLDHDESNLHRAHMALWGRADLDGDGVVIADIRDRERMHQVFTQHRPDVVFHAAALKHLAVLERHPCEAVKTNARGTENVIEAAVDHGVERMVFISTDKAANPTSVLGATKRIGELLLDRHAGNGTTLCAVRFGNVLGSRGSLLHVVKEQLAAGREITVTHPEVERFFMTIEEAVGLVLEAGRMGQDGATYVLDMGDPVRIVDLIRNFAEMLNFRALDFRFTGLKPGEKLSEELFGTNELQLPTDHPKVSMAAPVPMVPAFPAALNDLYDAAAHNRPDEVLQHMCRLVPEYLPPLRATPVFTSASPDPGDSDPDEAPDEKRRRTRMTSEAHLAPPHVRVLDSTGCPKTVFDDSGLLPADRDVLTALGRRVGGADPAAPPVVLPDLHHESKSKTELPSALPVATRRTIRERCPHRTKGNNLRRQGLERRRQGGPS